MFPVCDCACPHFTLLFLWDQKVDVNALIEGRPPIHYASDYGQKEVIQYLISKGADVNVSHLIIHSLACHLMQRHVLSPEMTGS